MIALLADEDFNARISRGLRRRVPEVNLLTVDGIGFGGQPDRTIVAWAAAHRRVVVTQDVNTMIDAALDRVRSGQSMPGLIAVPQQMAIGAAISDLLLIVTCAEPEELEQQIWYLPLYAGRRYLGMSTLTPALSPPRRVCDLRARGRFETGT